MGTNIGNVGGVNGYHNPYANAAKAGKDGGVNKALLEAILESPTDTYTPNIEIAADPSAIERLWKETNHVADAIRTLVQSMLGSKEASGQGFWAKRAQGGFKISEADRAHAQELISEDGFFGVKKTTERIMEFAKALVGENASEEQIENMRDAVQKGFDEVAKIFGGFDNLPEVSRDTYDAIMNAFDEWLGKAEAA